MPAYVADEATTRTVGAPSATFHYRRFGAASDVPLVLFNRFRGTLDTWDPAFLEALAGERDVIIFDNVGVARTDGKIPDTVDAYADGALEFIEALNLTEVDLLGWSLGGAIAQAVTLKRPELVGRVVVAGSGPGTVPGLPAPDGRVVEAMSKPGATVEDLNFLFYPERDDARRAADASNARIWGRHTADTPSVSEEAAERQFAALAGFFLTGQDNVFEHLESITQPVLYANGAHDVMMSPYNSYAAVERLPNATLLLYSDAGHGFLFQHAEKFGAVVTSFLRR
jgi:pimeloyl-ACP methyl ester carboxylesterase